MYGSLLGAFLILFLSACAFIREIDVEAYNQSIQKKIIQVENNLAKVDQDISFHEGILSKKLDQQQQRQIQGLKTQKLNILQSYVRLKEDYNSSRFLGRKKVNSKESDYPLLEKQQEDFKQRFEIIQKQFESYRQKSIALRKYLGIKA
jgi:hypothetical protein